MSKKIEWAKRTFTGYTLHIMTKDKLYIVKHRFMREPIYRSEPLRDKYQGAKRLSLYYSEASDLINPENLKGKL